MANTKGIGTAKVGYAGAHYGPFKCGNCVWLRPGEKCAHPEVTEDPQVPKKDGMAQVEKEACCNEFRPAQLNVGEIVRKAAGGK